MGSCAKEIQCVPICRGNTLKSLVNAILFGGNSGSLSSILVARDVAKGGVALGFSALPGFVN